MSTQISNDNDEETKPVSTGVKIAWGLGFLFFLLIVFFLFYAMLSMEEGALSSSSEEDEEFDEDFD